MFAKTFRNTLIASSLLVGASLLAGPAALAQTSSVEIVETNTATFSGAVETVIDNVVGVPSHLMGTLVITSNDPVGWTLEVASEKGGSFEHSSGLHSIDYTALTIGTVEGEITNDPVTFTDTTNQPVIDAAQSAAAMAGLTGIEVRATITAGQFVPSGVYTDTLTFTMVGKDTPAP